MNERGATMVSDQDIAEALESLLREANPNTTLTSLNGVVQQLESKLGLVLTHKVDFIRNQIQLLLRPQPTPPPPPQHHHLHHHLHPHPSKDHFALQQNPNFHAASSQLPPNFALQRPDEFGFRPPQPQVVSKTEAFVTDVATPATAAPDAPAEAPKESVKTGKKRRGGPGGLNKLCGVSPELQAIVGQPEMPRTEIVKQLWAYIRKNNLQDPSNKRKIICNDELRLVFETDCTDMFKMNKLLAKHIIPLEPTKQVGQNSKKLKVNVESGTETTESVPVVIISEALATFFGTDGREMLQSEVLRHVWEYIKVNQLEDPLNAMVIQCDAKLQELFGCQSISALGISEMLARHHLFKRS
ncbi:formin-like protein 18 [Cornus florida]|uniref:formin-like protein 18 n=1 Tax=Cornus florida TaxID=4283 RepID=UPI00289899F4|nr:formin-like protein 18 [Cornus florida]